MLILSRKTGQEIFLPDRGVTIEVVALKGMRVRLGVTAPSETEVYRGEVWHRIHQSHQNANDSRSGKQKTLRVLIADADTVLSSSYRQLLNENGFDVHTTTTGLDCLSRLRSFRPHVLVLDPSILWGGGDGVLAVIREDKEIPPVPVLIHTSPHDCDVSAELVFPVSARVSKPVSPKRMVFMVRQLADDNRMHLHKTPSSLE